MLKVQEFLNQYSLDALVEKYSIHVKRHIDYPNLVQLKYDQLNSPMSKDVVQECRGVILDENDNWKVICLPFTKFFNYHEGQADKINWKTATKYEKIDGSLMTMYHYDHKWHVASSGLPDASGQIKDQDFTMKDLFWKTWDELKFDKPDFILMNYMFEMSSPFTKIIVPHTSSSISLIGARDLESLEERTVEETSAFFNWNTPHTFEVESLEDAVEFCKHLNPMKQEGLVIVDSKFNRIKVKSPQYVCLGLLGHGPDYKKLDPKYILEIIRTNEGSEFLSYMPQYKDMYDSIKSKYETLIFELSNLYEEIKDIENQREFAIKAQTSKCSGLFFSLRNKKTNSVKDYLFEMNIKALVDILKI